MTNDIGKWQKNVSLKENLNLVIKNITNNQNFTITNFQKNHI